MLPGDKSPAARYRRRAQQCLEMARVFQDRDACITLLEMARVWHRLAHQHRDQPVMQQQQQQQVQKDEDKKS